MFHMLKPVCDIFCDHQPYCFQSERLCELCSFVLYSEVSYVSDLGSHWHCMLIFSNHQDSGLEEAWNVADIYRPTKTRQILEAEHMKRALEAHITTVQVLHDLRRRILQRPFPLERPMCQFGRTDWQELCSTHLTGDNNGAAKHTSHPRVQEGFRCHGTVWWDEGCQRQMSTLQVCEMVNEDGYSDIYTHDGLWELHLASPNEPCKYFFAYDKQKYARLVLLYLAEMNALKTTSPDIYQEFMVGNFAVNNNWGRSRLWADQSHHEGHRRSGEHYP